MKLKDKIPKTVKLKTYVLTTILLSLLSVAILNYALSPAYIGDVSEVWVQPPFHEASYVVGVYNSTFYYAQNGTTGEYEWLSATLATVINNAINALPNGGYISMQQGSYTCTAQITFDSGETYFIGAGRGVTTITFTSALGSNAGFYVTTSGNHIERMTIDMSDEGTHGIEIYHASTNVICDVDLQNVVENGISMSATAERNSNKIIDSKIHQAGQYAIYIGANIGHSWIERNVMSDSTGGTRVTDAGIYIASSLGQNVMYRNAIWGTIVGIHLSGSAYRVKIDDNTITDCWTSIEIEGTNGDVSIADNLFWYVGRSDPSPGDHNSDLYFNTASTQYAFKINDNNGNGQSVGYHFINCTNSNIFSNSIMDGNACQGYTSTEYNQGTQTGLTIGDNT